MRAKVFAALVAVVVLGCSKSSDNASNKNKSAAAKDTKKSSDPKDIDPKNSVGRLDAMKLHAKDGLRRLEFVVEGQSQRLTSDELVSVTARIIVGDQGDSKRVVFDLREIANILAGDKAHVVAVSGEDGSKAIDKKEWADLDKKPVLRMNRRGSFKFQYLDEDDLPLPNSDVRGIETVVIQK